MYFVWGFLVEFLRVFCVCGLLVVFLSVFCVGIPSRVP